MLFLLRCFGGKPGSNSGQNVRKHTHSSAACQFGIPAAAQGSGAPAACRSPTAETAVKLLQSELVVADQNGGSDGVAQVVDDEGDRQAGLVDSSFPRRISLGSPMLLFNSPSVATQQSLTLKLQGAARPASSVAPVDNWVALGSIADGRATADSADRTTVCSSLLHQRQPGSRADATATLTTSSGAGGTVRITAASVVRSEAAASATEPDPQPQCPSEQPGTKQTVSTVCSSLPAHMQRTHPPAVGSANVEQMRTSPSRCSNSSGIQAAVLGAGGMYRRHTGGTAGASCSAGACSTTPPVPRTLPVEELAVMVASLTRIRGHWLEALHSVVALAAELLGSDSLSVYLLSDSGATHAALACHGDAGGAVRLGMPMPALPTPGLQPTALQRLYATGEPQRGSVWSSGATAALAAPGGHQSTERPAQPAGSGSLPMTMPIPSSVAQDLGQSATQPRASRTASQQEPAPQHLEPQPSHNPNQRQQQTSSQQDLLQLQSIFHRQSAAPSLPPPQQQQTQQPRSNQSQPSAATLPADWQAMRVLGGMTDFAAVPLLRGDVVIGALQVVDNCTPPEDITGAMPTSRRCRGFAELSVVAAFISTLLVDHEVRCLMGALEAVASAQDVDGLVRALARHVGLFCCMRKHITPGVRVALIRGDATALALFLDEGAAAAASAAAAGNLTAGAAGGSTTPVGVLSTAISRHSTVYNLLQATSTVGGGGLPSGVCTPDPRHLRSPAASVSGMAMAGMGFPRGAQPAATAGSGCTAAGGGGGAAAGARCVIPLYSASHGTRDPSSILDTEPSLPSTVLAGGAPTGPVHRAPVQGCASGFAQPHFSTLGSGGRRGGGYGPDSPGAAHTHGNASISDRGGVGGGGGGAGGGGADYRLSGMVMSTGADLWPWFASTAGATTPASGAGRGAGGGGGAGADRGMGLNPQSSANPAPTVPARAAAGGGGIGGAVSAGEMPCAAFAGLTSTASERDMLVTCTREYGGAADEPAAARTGSATVAMDLPAGTYAIPMCAAPYGNSPVDGAVQPDMVTEPSLGDGHSGPSRVTSAAVAGAAAAAAVALPTTSAELFSDDVPATSLAAKGNLQGAAAAAAAAACANGCAGSNSMTLHSALLPGPPNLTGSIIAPTRGVGVGSGLYGRALAIAGEDGIPPGGGRGLGQVQGHAMLTRGTVLAEALAAGTGMYIADVAIYMQDGRNKSRDVFLAPSGRGGPAQPTNSIAVTTISHAGLPLVGIYLTYSTPLPASLLNALISKVHAFGAMLGPLLHERLTSGDSELADEWRYLLGEVLDPQAIQSVADEQRSRRSSAAPYNPNQQHHPPPLTAPPSPLKVLTGVAATRAPWQELTRAGTDGAGTAAGSAGSVAGTVGAATGGVGPAASGARSRVSQQTRRSSMTRGSATQSGLWRAAAQPVAPVVPPLRRSQTADSGSLITSTNSARAYPSADGSEAATRALVSSRGFGSLRASVTREAALKAVAACASEPAAVACASYDTGSATSLPAQALTSTVAAVGANAATARLGPYVRAGSARLPAAAPPSPPSPVVCGSAWHHHHHDTQQRAELPRQNLPSSAGAGPGSETARWRAPAAAGSGPAVWFQPQNPHVPSQPQAQRQQRAPLSAACASACSPQQQQRQPPAARRRLNCSWRGPSGTGPMFSVTASHPSVAVLTGQSPGGSPASKLEKAASEGVVSATASRGMLRGGFAGGRNVEGSSSIFLVESRAAQYGSSTVSSGIAIVSRSTSGALGPGVPAPASQLSQGCDSAAVNSGVVGGVLAPCAEECPGGSPPHLGVVARQPTDESDAAVFTAGGGCGDACGGGGGGSSSSSRASTALAGRQPSELWLPVEITLQVGQSSPSGAGQAAAEQERLLQFGGDCEKVNVGKAAQAAAPTPSRQQPQTPFQVPAVGHHVNPFAGGGPLSPPRSSEVQVRAGAAAGGASCGDGGGTAAAATGDDSSGDGGDVFPPVLRPAATLPLPLAGRLHAKVHRSPSLLSAAAAAAAAAARTAASVSPFVGLSTSQLELAGHGRLMPAFMASASSVGGGAGDPARTDAPPPAIPTLGGSSVSASMNASSHIDPEVSMQGWNAFVDPSGVRNLPAGGSSWGIDTLHGSTAPSPLEGQAAAGLGRPLAPPRLHPLAPSPFSPGRQYMAGIGAAAPPFVRRCSAGGIAPASPQPPPPQPRVGTGLSRLTTAAGPGGAAGGPGGGGAAFVGADGGPLKSPTGLAAAGATGAAAAAGASMGGGGGPPGPLAVARVPSHMVHRLRASVRRNTSFNIMADPGVQDTGKVAPLMANLQDKLRSLQAEQVLARLHSKDACSADELSGLTILEPLGSGGFGTVFRGIFNGIEVAVKVLCERGASGRSEAATMREAFELAVMTTISHPHIVQVLSAFTDVILVTRPNPAMGPNATSTEVLPRSPATEELGEPTVVIAMEYCDAGSLADAVQAGRFRQRVPGGYGALQPCMPAIYATLLEIALALRHMHAMLLVHCDLKPANILLKSNMRDPRGFSAKLSDFGLVKMVVEDGTGGGGGVIGRDARTGTVTHMAPELIRATEASKMDASVDIYAFGVLMWEMLSSAPVYLGLNSEDIRQGVVEGALRPEFPPWADDKYRGLAEACLSADPRARPTSVQLVARLRALLAESGALQDTIMRRPVKTVPGGIAAGGAAGFPGSATAAAAGAMLGIGGADFCRPSRLLPAPPPAVHPLAGAGGGAGGPHSRRGRSRSCSGNDSNTFPLHIL